MFNGNKRLRPDNFSSVITYWSRKLLTGVCWAMLFGASAHLLASFIRDYTGRPAIATIKQRYQKCWIQNGAGGKKHFRNEMDCRKARAVRQLKGGWEIEVVNRTYLSLDYVFSEGTRGSTQIDQDLIFAEQIAVGQSFPITFASDDSSTVHRALGWPALRPVLTAFAVSIFFLMFMNAAQLSVLCKLRYYRYLVRRRDTKRCDAPGCNVPVSENRSLEKTRILHPGRRREFGRRTSR